MEAHPFGILVNRFVLSSICFIFSFFIVSGNLLRFIDFGFMNNVLFTEFVLYFFSFIGFILFRPSFCFLYFILSILVCSAVLDILANGLSALSLLYMTRLVCMLFSGAVIGNLFYIKFKSSLAEFFKYIETMYLMNFALGLIIFISFSDSTMFWTFLSSFGIRFQGDPHSGRFVSTYFDPNFFAAICCIPLLLSIQLRKVMWKSALFVLGIFLTWSRSGIGTLIAVIIFLLIWRLTKANHLTFRRASVIKFGSVLFVLFGILSVYSDSLLWFFSRAIHVQTDNSALHRLYSFREGIDWIVEYPVLGANYNILTLQEGQTTIDSSVLFTFILFGIPCALLLFAAFFFWSINMVQRVGHLKRTHPQISLYFVPLFVYLCVCVVFTSIFNNLLYYPFWLIPIIAIFSYLLRCIEEAERCLKEERARYGSDRLDGKPPVALPMTHS